jgi:hypothetical protein
MKRVPHIPLSGIRRAKLAAVTGVTFLLGIIGVIPPEKLPLPPCLFREITGLPCFSCGLTRSLHAALRGDLSLAFSFHAMGPFLLAAMIAGVVVALADVFTGDSRGSWRRALQTGIVLAAALSAWIIHGVVRVLIPG